MSKYPRDEQILLPSLQRIQATWQDIREGFNSLPFTQKIIGLVGFLMLTLGAMLCCFIGTEHTVTETAFWRIDVDKTSLAEINLSLKESGQVEVIMSDRIQDHLQRTRPGSVEVTYKAVYDLGRRRGRGPILTVDGLAVDD